MAPNAPESPTVRQVESFLVHVPLLSHLVHSPEFEAHHANPRRRLIRVLDSDGHEGWGEGADRGAVPDIDAVMRTLLHQPLDAPRLAMLDLHAPDRPSYAMPAPPSPYANPPANLQHRLRHPCQSAFETALLDLTARRAGVPAHQLLGGAWRDRVKVDYWMGRTTPEFAAECARRGKALGFNGIKLKTTLEDPNVERLEAIRDAAGAAFTVTVDPNGRFYRLDDARRTIYDMDRVGNMAILEDPFPREALHENLALRPQLDARLVAHIDPPESLWRVISSGAAGGLNIDSHTQGLFNWRLQAGAAGCANLPVWHGSGLDLGVATAAQLHLAASAANCQLPGDQVGPWLRESHLLTDPFTVEDGAVRVPAGSGWGVQVDRDALDRYTTEHRCVEA